jgi:long-chain fatty acid transport protein
MMKVHRVSRLLLALAAVAAPTALHAQAFGLNEIGSCAIARGFAATASPCKDASTIYWNSAAATSLSGWSVVGGLAAISVKGSFQQDTTLRTWNSDIPTALVPHFFVNYKAPASKLAWGLGVYVPYGLTSQWTDDFPGRFSAKKAAIKTLYIQPNVAWQFNDKWSIGGGPIFGHSTIELVQAADLSGVKTSATGPTFGQLGIATGTEFARATVKGHASALGGQIAIQGRPTANVTFGARFMTSLKFQYDNADATFAQVNTGLTLGGSLQPPFTVGTPVDALVASQFTGTGALTAQNATTTIVHPAQFQTGLAYSGFKNWLLEADYAWVEWKQFNELPVTFLGPASINNRVLIEDYHNSSAIRLGAEYSMTSDGWKLRAGFAGVQSAAPAETVTPLLPEQDRNYWTVGAGIPLMSRFTLDASYARVATPGSRGRIQERTARSQTAAQLNTGVFDLSANVFSFTLKANF